MQDKFTRGTLGSCRKMGGRTVEYSDRWLCYYVPPAKFLYCRTEVKGPKHTPWPNVTLNSSGHCCCYHGVGMGHRKDSSDTDRDSGRDPAMPAWEAAPARGAVCHTMQHRARPQGPAILTGHHHHVPKGPHRPWHPCPSWPSMPPRVTTNLFLKESLI